MALPDFSVRQLLEAGVHFGHQTQRWNPRMAPYIYGERNGIHIVDLTQTVELLEQALKEAKEKAADRASNQKAMQQTGLDLPGIRVTAKRNATEAG